MRRSTRISLHILETASSGKGAIRVNMCPLGGTLRELVLSLLPRRRLEIGNFLHELTCHLSHGHPTREMQNVFSRVLFSPGGLSRQEEIFWSEWNIVEIFFKFTQETLMKKS